MKKVKIVLILFVTCMILGACSGEKESMEEALDEQNKEEAKVENETTDDTDKEGSSATPEEPEDLYDIQLNEATTEIELIAPGGEKEVLAADGPSEPVKSPDGKKAVYISPHDWETLGSVYLVDLESGKQEALVPAEGENTSKNVIWQDENHLFVIIGYAYGTVSIGGSIFSVDIETKEKVLIAAEENVEITDLYIDNDTLYYKGIEYIDDSMNEHVEYSNHLSLDEVNQKLKTEE